MKLFRSDILKYFGDVLGKDDDTVSLLSQLSVGSKLVFYYDIDEKSFPSLGDVKMEEKVVINEIIYRERVKYKKENISILSEPFDSQNYFLYLLMQDAGFYYANQNNIHWKIIKNKIDDVFLMFKAQDIKSKRNRDVSVQVAFDVVDISSLEKALSNFITRGEIVQSLLNLTRMLANSYQCVFNKLLLGESLTKVVAALKTPDGGLMKEQNGSMRYMIVGENSNYKEVEGVDSLATARDLKRAGLGDNDIYLETGWFLNEFDGRWRKKINDEGYFIKDDYMIETPSAKIFAEESFKDLVLSMMAGEKNAYQLLLSGYGLVLDDLLFHPSLFLYYPTLKQLPVFYTIFRNKLANTYYFSPKDPKHIHFKGSDKVETILTQDTILLHEVQHGVQNIEGFATGGNTNMATAIQTVGGKHVREYFSYMESIKKDFCARASVNYDMISNAIASIAQRRNEFFIKTGNANADARMMAYINNMFDNVIKSSYTVEVFSDKCENTIYSILGLITNTGVISPILDFFNKIGMSHAEKLVNMLLINKRERDAKISSMKSQLWSDTDINALFSNYYLFLVGEVESRYTQSASLITKDLENYFTPYTSEHIPKEYVTVFYDMPIEERNMSAKGALETYDNNKYILHLFKSLNGSEYLHELGHIVYDICKEYYGGIEVASIEAFSKMPESDKKNIFNEEEYFCHCFVNYILRKQLEPVLSEANKLLSEASYSDFDDYISGVLSLEPNVDYSRLKNALKFIKELQILC